MLKRTWLVLLWVLSTAVFSAQPGDKTVQQRRAAVRAVAQENPQGLTQRKLNSQQRAELRQQVRQQRAQAQRKPP